MFHTTAGAGAPKAVQDRLIVLWTSTDTSSEYISMTGGTAAQENKLSFELDMFTVEPPIMETLNNGHDRKNLPTVWGFFSITTSL